MALWSGRFTEGADAFTQRFGMLVSGIDRQSVLFGNLFPEPCVFGGIHHIRPPFLGYVLYASIYVDA